MHKQRKSYKNTTNIEFPSGCSWSSSLLVPSFNPFVNCFVLCQLDRTTCFTQIQFISAFEMTYIVSGRALNSTHSLCRWTTFPHSDVSSTSRHNCKLLKMNRAANSCVQPAKKIRKLRFKCRNIIVNNCDLTALFRNISKFFSDKLHIVGIDVL